MGRADSVWTRSPTRTVTPMPNAAVTPALLLRLLGEKTARVALLEEEVAALRAALAYMQTPTEPPDTPVPPPPDDEVPHAP